MNHNEITVWSPATREKNLMPHLGRTHFGAWLGILLAAAVCSGLAAPAHAIEIVLKDGRVLRGEKGQVAGLADVPSRAEIAKKGSDPDSSPLQLIVFLDDNLRRTYFSDRLVREVRQEENRQLDEKFALRHRVLHSGLTIRGVGQPVHVGAFDEFGVRIFTINTARGLVDVVQAITELTPQWTKVEGISHAWDMRIATSCIPRDTLRKILLKQIDRKSVEGYKKVARFYLQCERYADARQILEGLLAAFPDESDLKEQLAPSLRAITQLSAQQLLGELKLRHDAGQHQLVEKALKQFPTEGVGGEILQAVREMTADYETRQSRCRDVVKHLKALAAKIPDTIARENLKPILDEMAAEINFNTLDRMAAFLQSADDRETEDAEKLSLAISGWLLGADAATPKLPTAISAYKVRGLILEYLAAVIRAGTRTDLRLHQAGVGRGTGGGGRVAGAHEAAGGRARAGGRQARLL